MFWQLVRNQCGVMDSSVEEAQGALVAIKIDR